MTTERADFIARKDKIRPNDAPRLINVAPFQAKNDLRDVTAKYRAAPPSICRLSPLFSVAEIKALAARIPQNVTTLVVLGTGGSTLCPQALTGATGGRGENGRRVLYVDNVDYDEIAPLLNGLKMQDVVFLATSKSGDTLETLAQFALCVEHCRKSAPTLPLGERFIVLSDPATPGRSNRLREFAQRCGVTAFDHEDVGGRFSVFTAVGLLPAAFIGMDVDAVMQGARDAALTAFDENSPSAQGALWRYTAESQGYAVDIWMSYTHKLKAFMAWLAQLWAESMGKNRWGLTPVTSVGTLDQHSQLQLFLDGKQNKLFNIFYECGEKSGALGDAFARVGGMEYLRGKHLSDVLTASARATADTLAAAGAPLRVRSPKAIDEYYLGRLAMESMAEVIMTADMFGVNPYDQPAVEAGKKRAVDMLSRP